MVGLDLQHADHGVADFIVGVGAGAELGLGVIVEDGPVALGADLDNREVGALGGPEQGRTPFHADRAGLHFGVGELQLDIAAVAFLQGGTDHPQLGFGEFRYWLLRHRLRPRPEGSARSGPPGFGDRTAPVRGA